MQKTNAYRKRAEELRIIAEDWIDPESRASLRRLARQYERMAEERERKAGDARGCM